MPSRRQFLGSTAIVAATAGCLTSLDAGGGDDGDGATTLEPGERTRGEADPISTERAVDDSDLEYIESNGTVRYPEKKSGETVVEYGYISVDEWAHNESWHLARQTIASQFRPPQADREYIDVTSEEEPTEQEEVVVHHVTVRDESGETVHEPRIDCSTLVSELPRTATVSVELAGRSATNAHDVFVTTTVGTT